MSGGNYMAYNLGLNPAVNFNFMIRVEGLFDLPCKSVRAFQRENEYEYIQEGGLNDYVHMRRKPVSKPSTIQIERYVGIDMLDPLANGTELVLPLILYVNRYSIYGEFHPVRTYFFSGCTVMSKEYGELNAEQSGLMVETTTIAYREMYTVDNIATSFVTEDTWEFDSLKKEGNGNRKARTTGADNLMEKSKDEAKKDAGKWTFKNGDTERKIQEEKRKQEVVEYTITGGNNQNGDFLGLNTSSKSAEYSKNAKRKKQMEAASVKYSFEGESGLNTSSSREKQRWQSKARKWPETSSAVSVASFMNRAKLGR